MKYSFLICLICLACNSSSNTKLQASFPGIYVRVISHEFATGNDTLVVALLDQHTGTFSIVKKAGFIQFVDGKAIGRKNTTEKFTAVFDEVTGTLNDHHKMKTFTPVPDKGLLLTGSLTYKKVKE
ncbi:MAG: hypothetical protein J0I84_15695 [Terrimonas sp.]|nr:hypothetical protein [Terrimonas sp.]OJY92188.1 MAG: hypothetical protein BGP13_08475 [Sphingobacteriales bacterium 40-81]